MKKFFFLACLMMAAILAQPVQSASLVIRSGNKYIVDNRTYNKKEFCRYMDGRDMQTYQKFKSGMRVANAGWGLFAAGGALNIAGIGMLIGGVDNAVRTQTGESATAKAGDIEVIAATEAGGIVIGGVLAVVVGSLLQTSSIICLGVGYGRMHNAADMYNISAQNHFRAELRPSSTGLGFALAW